MKQFKIYEIPGVKIGATDRWPKRVIEQGYRPEECNILFETDVLKLASSMERVLQKRHGYKVDQNRYEDAYNANHGRVISEETRAKHSAAAIKRNADIAADPVRATQKSAKMSEAQAAIAADPVRAAQKSQRHSEAQAAIAADPVRAASRSVKMSKAARENKAQTTYQIDPETNITVGVFQSTAAAAWLVGYKNGSNINTAKRSGEIKKGFRWK